MEGRNSSQCLPVYLWSLAVRHSSAGMTSSDSDGTVSKSVTLQEGAGEDEDGA
jgi:hypothetical protein